MKGILSDSGSGCLHSWFESQSQSTPARIAVAMDDESLTYEQLNRLANRVAHRLISRGIMPGDLVGISLHRSLDLIVGMLGILKAGAAYAPLDPSLPQARVQFILDDMQAKMVVSSRDVATRLSLDNNRFFDVELCHLPHNLDAEHEDLNPVTSVTTHDTAYIIYTSGSTGKPKGVLVSHSNVCRLFTSTQPWFEFSSDDVWTLFHSFAFDFSVWEIWGALLYGGKLIVVPFATSRSPIDFYRLIAREKVTILNQTPSAFRQLIRADEELHRSHPLSLRAVVFGGEALEFSSLRPWVQRHGDQQPQLINMYGITETTVHVTYRPVSQHDIYHESSSCVGIPIPDLQLYVLDERGQQVSAGTTGEIYVGGEGVAQGYLNRPDLNAERFVPDPFSPHSSSSRLYKTGDLGRFRTDGELEYLGRADRQVQLRGFRVELGEIESRLQDHQSVSQVIVVVRTDQAELQQLIAYVIPKLDQTIHPKELRAFLSGALPEYMIPQFFIAIEAIPLTGNGKLDTHALPLPSSQSLPLDYVAPRNRSEEMLAQVWGELLQLSPVTTTATFFELGGQSLMLPRMETLLRGMFPRTFQIIDLLQYPTISALASYLSQSSPSEADTHSTLPQFGYHLDPTSDQLEWDIAIIGMSGRFPGAPSVQHFWSNLKQGIESIHRLTSEELRQAGISQEEMEQSNFVPFTASLDDVQHFDAEFFGFSPREATITDPQHRLFLECAWSALEDAGYVPEKTNLRIGVFAGARPNSYRELVHQSIEHLDPSVALQTLLANEKDFLATRVAHRLDLRGPCMSVQTGCSTSLVAVQLACQSLQLKQCQIALAGGVSVNLEYQQGYRAEEGMILSKDGHVRAFDDKASGTVFGEGLGIVVLKRLSQAIADGDTIHAVIRGIGVNNDGASKISFAAPSIEGQTEVIQMAHELSRISADEVGYVEAHGTGTYVGDPVEFAALQRAFASTPMPKQSCGVGSVKTNVGHQDVAAGIVGLIKTALIVRDGIIPPSLHFESANKNLNLESSPFYIPTELAPWPIRCNTLGQESPRIAGVSSFGVGGTNAHAILQQPPRRIPLGEANKPFLLVWSARNSEAFQQSRLNLGRFLESSDEIRMSDVAYTLQMGRRELAHRAALVCNSRQEAATALGDLQCSQVLRNDKPISGNHSKPEVVFMFPGQGSQYLGMAQDLYDSEPVFRNEVDHLAALALPWLGEDLRQHIFAKPPMDTTRPDLKSKLTETWLAQPAIFVIEMALAKLWISWGVVPAMVVGHSVGEFAAACIAGVFPVDVAIRLVILRGKLLYSLPRGSMLSIAGNVDLVSSKRMDNISIAAINSPSHCVVSGPSPQIAAFAELLAGDGIACQPLQTSHAFHSNMTEPILVEFMDAVGEQTLNDCSIPMISTVTGQCVTNEEVRDPVYWGRNIRETVLFSNAVAQLNKEPGRIYLEIGPGNTLSTLLRAQPDFTDAIIPCIRHPKQVVHDRVFLMQAVGQCWIAGAHVDWEKWNAGQTHQRISLPTYPFQRQRYWVDAPHPPVMPSSTSIKPLSPSPRLLNAEIAAALPPKQNDISDWFYVPTWKKSPTHFRSSHDSSDHESSVKKGETWLVLSNRSQQVAKLCDAIRSQGVEVIVAETADVYSQRSHLAFELSPTHPEHFDQMLKELNLARKFPQKIIHAWTWESVLPDSQSSDSIQQLEARLDRGLYSLQALAQTLGRTRLKSKLEIEVISCGLFALAENESTAPERATLIGACKVIPLEYREVHCRLIDVPLEINASNCLLAEWSLKPTDLMVAYRDGQRWLPDVRPVRLGSDFENNQRLRANGTYLITGGLGGIGFAIARLLAKQTRGNLVLVGRSELPDRAVWDQWLDEHTDLDATSLRIQRIRHLESLGAKVLVISADTSDVQQIRRSIDQSKERFGNIHGVIHSAGLADTAGAIQMRSRQTTDRMLCSKVLGTMALHAALEDQQLDFWILCSSISNWLYHNRYAQLSYVAGNSFLDSYATWLQSKGQFAVSIAWDEWQDIGMAAQVARDFAESFGTEQRLFDPLDSFSPAQGETMAHRILNADESQVLISTRDLGLRIQLDVSAKSPFLEAARSQSLVSSYNVQAVAPSHPTLRGDQRIALMWQKLLGVSHVTADDNYFQLGGDSLSAVRFLSDCERQFGEKISFATMVAYPTPGRLSQFLELDRAPQNAEPETAFDHGGFGVPIGATSPRTEPRQREDKTSTVVEMARGSGLPPLFLMHAADGYTLIYQSLVQRLKSSLPIYAVQSCGFQGHPLDTIEGMASVYVRDIQRVCPTGPYLIAGYCMGGTVALEVAQQLIQQGASVAMLACMETYNWQSSQAASQSFFVRTVYELQRIYFHSMNFLISDSVSRRKFLRAKWKVWKRRSGLWRQRFSKSEPIGDESISETNSTATTTWSNAELWRKHDLAAEAYLPKEYPGKIVCIRAKRDYGRYRDAPLPARDGVEIHRLPVYPAGMMVEPFIDQLAEALSKHLEQAIQNLTNEESSPQFSSATTNRILETTKSR